MQRAFLIFLMCLAPPLLAALSCDANHDRDHAARLIFVTESDPGVSLSGVSVWVDGALVGVSSDGAVETLLRSTSTSIIRVEHDCPEGHRDPVEDTILRLSSFEEIGVSEALGMEVTLRCPPETHIAGFVVRLGNGPSLPVLLNGVEVARTSSAGIAHFTRRGRPGTEYSVQIDTSSDSRLGPQHPTKVFTLDDQHEVFVVDQAFALAKEPRRARRPRGRILKIE